MSISATAEIPLLETDFAERVYGSGDFNKMTKPVDSYQSVDELMMRLHGTKLLVRGTDRLAYSDHAVYFVRPECVAVTFNIRHATVNIDYQGRNDEDVFSVRRRMSNALKGKRLPYT